MSSESNAYRYKRLVVWQRAMALVVRVYKATESFPKHEQYGLISQMRRSAVSIPSNIAEGHGRNSDKELVRFLDIAKGSIYELDTQIEIARQLNYLKIQEDSCISNLLDETSRMLSGLRKSKSQYSILKTDE
ncbi:four helix bundle protein [Desulfobacter postgatei]|uniref:four helix bundle protein n=1 Tax=Desulfobacter postgatei TaxID=2293 RepID=UPI00259B7177|nr:four helix bundle protein [uncultured Desulfobacter sp.]